MKPVGPIVKKFLEENQIKQTELAERMDMSRSGLSQMLSNPTITAQKLEKLCLALGISPMTFFDIDDDAKISNYSDLKDISGITNIGNASVNIGDSAIVQIMKEKDKLLAEKNRLIEEKERTIQILMRQTGLDGGA